MRGDRAATVAKEGAQLLELLEVSADRDGGDAELLGQVFDAHGALLADEVGDAGAAVAHEQRLRWPAVDHHSD